MTKKRDYAVGYGKPPIEKQFKKGQSPNPSGRPKGARSLKDDFRAELCELVRLNESGKIRYLTKQRVIVKALTTKAARSDTPAISKTLELILQLFGTGEDGEAAGAPLSANDEAVIAAALARAARSGKAPQK